MPSPEIVPSDGETPGLDPAQVEGDARAEAALDEALEETFSASDPAASNLFD